MTAHRVRGSFWTTNHLVNPILVHVLRRSWGRRIGRHLAILAYTGRRSGRRHELVVQYAREGKQVWIVPGKSQRKTWWRNFNSTSSVELRLAGEDFQGRAVVLGGEQSDELRKAVATYLRHLPRAAKGLGVKWSEDRGSDPTLPLGGMVVVQVDLNSTPALDLAGLP